MKIISNEALEELLEIKRKYTLLMYCISKVEWNPEDYGRGEDYDKFELWNVSLDYCGSNWVSEQMDQYSDYKEKELDNFNYD